MTKRRQARDQAFQILFEKTFTDASVSEIIDMAGLSRDMIADDYTVRAAEGTDANREQIDGIISRFSVRRSISRLSRVVISVLRLAVYEIIYEDTVDASVAINEAVELAKTYAGEDEGSFVNGVLGSFVRSEDFAQLANKASGSEGAEQ